MPILQDELIQVLDAAEAFAKSRKDLVDAIELEHALVEEGRQTHAEAFATLRAIIQPSEPPGVHYGTIARVRQRTISTHKRNTRRRLARGAQAALELPKDAIPTPLSGEDL